MEERRTADRRQTTRETPDRRTIEKMACPECGCRMSIILPYRPKREVEDGFGRVRLCDNGHRFDTYEYVSPLPKIFNLKNSSK